MRKPEIAKFYVYALLDGSKPGHFPYGNWKFKYEPFYIGKGTGIRHRHSSDFSKTNNSFKRRKMEKIMRSGCEIHTRILRKDLTEYDAFGLETRLILKVGRRDQKIGPLTNLTDGGEGWAGQSRHSLKKRMASRKITIDAQTDEHKREIIERTKATVMARSKEETARIIQKARATKDSFSEKKKREIVAAIASSVKEHYASLKPSEIKARYAKQASTNASISDVEREFRSGRRSDAMRQSYATKSEAWFALKSESHTRANLKYHASVSDCERKRRSEKISEGVSIHNANKSKAQIDSESAKKKRTWAAKTPEQCAEIQRKRRSTILARQLEGKVYARSY